MLRAAGADKSFVVRAGLITGPDDESDRFGYWPARLARGGEVLAPGTPDDVVQVIDVRDLAAWILDACATGTTGVYDGVGAPTAIGDLLAEVAAGVGAPAPLLTWVDGAFLEEQGVEHWSGDGSVPLRAVGSPMKFDDSEPSYGLPPRLDEHRRDILPEPPQ